MISIKDPIHGMIYFPQEFKYLLNHPIMNRLRRIKQLSLAYLIYPGATHTRYEHSLGVYGLVEKYFHIQNIMRARDRTERTYYQKLSENERRALIQQSRYYALLHDVGHVAFSHDAEHVLGLMYSGEIKAHFEREKQYVKVEDLKDNNGKPNHKFHEQLGMALSQLIIDDIGKNLKLPSDFELLEVPLISFDAGLDRLDYLVRDAYYTGTSYGVIETDFILKNILLINPNWREHNSWRIDIEGSKSIEAMLIGRYMMFQNVYNHNKVLKAAAILRKLIYRALKHNVLTLEDIINSGDDVVLWKLSRAEDRKIRTWALDIINRRLDIYKQIDPENRSELDVLESDEDIFIYVSEGKSIDSSLVPKSALIEALLNEQTKSILLVFKRDPKN
ncbi:MAG: hypothetical protein QXU27_00365 [Candidatus Anstonellales archaeon]